MLDHYTRKISPAREREHVMMRRLAEILCDGTGLIGYETTDEVRQLGYAAHLARGRVTDRDDNLGQVIDLCRIVIIGIPAVQTSYRDPAQALWGASWHLDAMKLRNELPFHVLRHRLDKLNATQTRNINRPRFLGHHF